MSDAPMTEIDCWRAASDILSLLRSSLRSANVSALISSNSARIASRICPSRALQSGSGQRTSRRRQRSAQEGLVWFLCALRAARSFQSPRGRR
jgi:hypothetical protein